MSRKTTVIENQRDRLHSILTSIKGPKKVYYQPPSTERLVYPCLIYTLEKINTRYANGNRYLSVPLYTLLLIDYDPESIIQKEIMDLRGDCHVKFNRYYTADNLNHWSYDLYFTKALW